MKIEGATELHGPDGVQYHVRARTGQAGGYALLPGDPGRVPEIAALLESSEKVSEHREFHLWRGVLSGERVAVCSTGIGAPSTAIAVEELARIGVHTFVRVGSSGAIQEDIRCGDAVISTGALREDGATQHYVNPSYPAVATPEVCVAMTDAARQLGHRHHLGLTVSTSAFYVGEGRPGFGGYSPSHVQNVLSDWQAARVLNVEMECACLFVLASLFGLRAGAVCAVYDNVVTGDVEITGQPENIQIAVEGLRLLIDRDRARAPTAASHVTEAHP